MAEVVLSPSTSHYPRSAIDPYNVGPGSPYAIRKAQPVQGFFASPTGSPALEQKRREQLASISWAFAGSEPRIIAAASITTTTRVRKLTHDILKNPPPSTSTSPQPARHSEFVRSAIPLLPSVSAPEIISVTASAPNLASDAGSEPRTPRSILKRTKRSKSVPELGTSDDMVFHRGPAYEPIRRLRVTIDLSKNTTHMFVKEKNYFEWHDDEEMQAELSAQGSLNKGAPVQDRFRRFPRVARESQGNSFVPSGIEVPKTRVLKFLDKRNFNCPANPQNAPINLERNMAGLYSFDIEGKKATGIVIVRNVTYRKDVCVRYTTDKWHVFQDHAACWVSSLDGSFDLFKFEILLPEEVYDDGLQMAIR
eukprot:Colp12_sorted_trinity150504_noHs@17837